MNKIILLLCVVLTAQHIFAQKADVNSQIVKTYFDQPEFLKNTKTYSYTIQDDDEYWNYTATENNPTIASNTEGLNLKESF